MNKLSIITFTLGTRDTYLKSCINSVNRDINESKPKFPIEHHIVYQGAKCPYKTQVSEDYSAIFHEWETNIGIGAGINKIVRECSGNLLFKMDDDCEIVTRNFFNQAMWFHEQYRTAIFSPQPLGLVNNPMGPPGYKREVIYNQNLDRYYTLRYVNHVGGFARFWPKAFGFEFESDLIAGISGNEDGQLSSWASQNPNIKMFYVETGMAVEHKEGLGQQIRYQQYFDKRTGDKETLARWTK